MHVQIEKVRNYYKLFFLMFAEAAYWRASRYYQSGHVRLRNLASSRGSIDARNRLDDVWLLYELTE